MNFVCAFGLSLFCAAGLASGGVGHVVVENDGQVDKVGLFEDEVASYREMAAAADSGMVRIDPADVSDSLRATQIPVWSQVVEIDDAEWVRLRFGQVVLAKSTELVRESYIRVTSLEDGYEQYLDAESIVEWGNTSAYFNGGAVLVELMASPNVSSQLSRVQVVGVQASAPVSSERSICFTVDDRVLSSDARDGRLMPIGCSAWLFGEHGSCFLTASHCSPSGGNVMQFNVPLSSGGGGYRNPPPSDQYVVDGASVQRSSSIFIGNDWGYFGTFDNSTTGLAPGLAQGATHTLAGSMPPVDGRPIRITGYGTVSSPVSGTWNGVQKTHVGPLASINGNTVRYQTDTTGGNSGSVILDDSNNTAIGIHTNAGCGSSGGSNQGTGLFNSGLQGALANPIGICVPRSIQASILLEPTHVDPAGGDVVTLVINNLQGHSIVGTPMMFVDSGSGFAGSAMTSAGGNFEGVFGAIDCGATVSYYFSIEDEAGLVITVPALGASGAFATVSLDSLTLVMEDDFETNTGWQVISNASAGGWERTIPADHNLGDPASDADGSDKCYVTANNFGVDVDNGDVTLISPLADLTGIDSPVLRMSLWMFGSSGDTMTISFTDSAGAFWTDVETLTNTNGWEDVEYNIEDYVSLNLAFRARIVVADGGGNSTVEGGVDAFAISSEVCDASCIADITGDGVLNFFDISAFLSAFSAGDLAADFTGDGMLNFFDISAFLTAFSDGCP